MSAIILNDENFEREIKESTLPVLVDFWAEWCTPCQLIGPMVERLSEEYSDKLKVGRLNVDEAPNTSSIFKIEAIPTLLIFKNGEVVDKIVGLTPYNILESKIKPYL